MKALDNNENNEILEENAENQDELVLDEDIELDKDMNTKVTEEYDASQIQVLEGLEAVRKRPGMYIGSTGPRGLHHLVYEIVDNSIDEALAGFCTNIDVEILPGNVISVKDNGRGIPVGMNEKMGISTVTVVLTVLHAGGKFGGNGYKVSGGLHGVGSSVVNALSEWLEVEVAQNGHVYQQRFSNGGHPDYDLKEIGTSSATGTTIRFKPDPEIFRETTVYDFETLERHLRESAFLNAGLCITLADRRDPDNIIERTYCYEGGLSSFVDYLTTSRGQTPLHEKPIHFSAMHGDRSAEIAMQYGYVYVAQVAMGANPAQTIKAITEAEAYHGPSLIIGYSPCEMHSIKGGMMNCQKEMKKAVDCGYWNLFRFNPAAEKKFTLDSKAPAGGYHDFLMNEARYSRLTREFPDRAENLFARNEAEAKARYDHLLKLIEMYDD